MSLPITQELTKIIEALTADAETVLQIKQSMTYQTAAQLIKENQIVLVSATNLYIDLTNFDKGSLIDIKQPYKIYDANHNLIYIVQNHTALFGRNSRDQELAISRHNELFYLEYATSLGLKQICLYVFNRKTEAPLIFDELPSSAIVRKKINIEISFKEYTGKIKIYYKSGLYYDLGYFLKTAEQFETIILQKNKTLLLSFEELSSIVIKTEEGSTFYLKTYNRNLTNYIEPVYKPIYQIKNIVTTTIKLEAIQQKNNLTDTSFLQQPGFFKIDLKKLKLGTQIRKTRNRIFLTFSQPENTLAGSALDLAGSTTVSCTGNTLRSSSSLYLTSFYDPTVTIKEPALIAAGSQFFFIGDATLTTSYAKTTASFLKLDYSDEHVTVPALTFSNSLTNFTPDPEAANLTAAQITDLGETIGNPSTGSLRTNRLNLAAFYKMAGIQIIKGPRANVPFFSVNQTSATPVNQPNISNDSPFVNKIPTTWNRYQLPTAYFGTVGSAYIGFASVGSHVEDNGLGTASIRSSISDPVRTIRLATNFPIWPNTNPTYGSTPNAGSVTIRIPDRVNHFLGNTGNDIPTGALGRRVVSWSQENSNDLIETTSTCESREEYIGDWAANNIVKIRGPLLGSEGGVSSSGVASIAGLLTAGEIINATKNINHALRVNISPDFLWAKSQVFPASTVPSNAETINNGLIPFGALLQLYADYYIPSSLSLPAKRILRAMQEYGFYVVGVSTNPIEIITNGSMAELVPYGGKNQVLTEIANVLATQPISICLPLAKYGPPAAAPIITGFTPANPTPGSLVTLNGSNIIASSIVNLNNGPNIGTIGGGSSCSFIVPANQAINTNFTLRLTNPGGNFAEILFRLT